MLLSENRACPHSGSSHRPGCSHTRVVLLSRALARIFVLFFFISIPLSSICLELHTTTTLNLNLISIIFVASVKHGKMVWMTRERVLISRGICGSTHMHSAYMNVINIYHHYGLRREIRLSTRTRCWGLLLLAGKKALCDSHNNFFKNTISQLDNIHIYIFRVWLGVFRLFVRCYCCCPR